MALYLSILLGIVSLCPVLAQVIFNPRNNVQCLSGLGKSQPLDISSLRNNRAFGMNPGDANVDSFHRSYPAQFMPNSSFIYNSFNYTFPTYKPSGNDNVLAEGQTLRVPPGRYFSVRMLAASETGLASGTINATYADGNTDSGPVLVPAWWTWPYPAGGDLIFPFYYTNTTVNYNRSNIYETNNWLDSNRQIVSLTLPNVTAGPNTGPGGSEIDTRLHVFAVSLWPVTTTRSKEPQLQIQYARSTQKWMPGTNKTQIVEVLVNNIGRDAWVLGKAPVNISIESDGLETVTPATIKRLRPGDQVVVEVGVTNKKEVPPGSYGNATVRLSGGGIADPYVFNATFGIGKYLPTYESIYTHETPSWFNGAKYGIFIHWGVYAVPGWGNTGENETYAEWYWWSMNQGPDTTDQTYGHHLETYGPDVVYDDFIQNFTADAFSPKDWVDLFAEAGANYFIQVSKHHDGYAIFDLPENVTKRTSVALFPHRNLLQEIFDAAKKYQPQLHRGTYYSFPEWFHPDYRQYGFGTWPGGNATNPYTNETLPYTGYVPLRDYITDKIVPEMNTLANMGTEIMWCDIGGSNLTADFASSWFNQVADTENRQVVLDARCGLPGDFDTPEYARYDAVQRRKWESSLGMDPFSYGYNRATPLKDYLNASSIVSSLVDIVSKNGNFLLDVGPMPNGTIVPIEQRNLRQAGVWIRDHDEAIFNTTYWFVTPQEGKDVRFTTTMDAFYILLLQLPVEEEDTFTLTSPIPWVEGDEVRVVGGTMNGAIVPSRKTEDGVEFTIGDYVRDGDQFAWVFKIQY